jgi:peptidoglycan/xylan/chitin deacetylase (PgdA/CDA1 family)
VVRATSGRPEVALTFHGAGPLDITRQVLALLAKNNAKVTVFAVGTWLQATPDGARMVRDGGHELGNHTWSHPDLEAYQPGPMLTEIERCRDELSTVAGTPGVFFRQSQGQHATARELVAAGQAGYARTLSYDVDSLDWTDPGAAAIRRAVTAATAGSVVSMHLGHPGTVQALPGILTDLAARGLTPVTATELLR